MTNKPQKAVPAAPTARNLRPNGLKKPPGISREEWAAAVFLGILEAADRIDADRRARAQTTRA